MVYTYIDSPLAYKRLKTHEVQIGDLLMGAQHPIRVQSMTTTDTMDTDATVAQSIRMIEAGCELVRITAPSINEAKNLERIKAKLRSMGYNTPICADIHFTPNAAEFAARIVEKVRVNPGNYADKKKFEQIEYTDLTYNAELERIYERFLPLVKICKTYGTAMRIGTNHGSLSDRILSRYGDTPKGMVESALEFIRICEAEQYYNIVISMKASNTQVMVQAYRLLVAEMRKTERSYPLHLGVTEAGDGEDGRIKSAVGIGALLEDGIGDTVRVSLTEDPEFEIPVARALINRYATKRSSTINSTYNKDLNYNPYKDIILDKNEYVQSFVLNKEFYKIYSNLLQIKNNLKGKLEYFFNNYGDIAGNDTRYFYDEEINELNLELDYNLYFNDNELIDPNVINRHLIKIYSFTDKMLFLTKDSVLNNRVTNLVNSPIPIPFNNSPKNGNGNDDIYVIE